MGERKWWLPVDLCLLVGSTHSTLSSSFIITCSSMTKNNDDYYYNNNIIIIIIDKALLAYED